jgi:heme/copper-type cytochrome/quinol oxidase subunit 3
MSTSATHDVPALAEQQTLDVSTYEVLPADLAPPEPARPRLTVIGTMLAGIAVIAGFAALIGVYVLQRAEVIATGERWLPEGVDIPLTQPNFMAVTMGMSALSMLWAVYASRTSDRANTLIALGLTLLFGFAFISQTFFLLTLMDMPIADSGVQGWLIWAIVGSHVAVVAAGLAWVLGAVIRTIGGHLSLRDQESIVGATMFWFVAVGVYLVIWYAIYITK